MKKILIISLCLLCLGGCTSKNDIEDNKKQENKPVENIEPTEESKQPIEEDNNAENQQESDNNQTEENTTPEKLCTPKKFAQKYKYFYATEAECHKEGESTAFFDITDNVDSRVFTINCDKIVDDCGQTWYGVSYNIYDPENSARDDGVVVVYY